MNCINFINCINLINLINFANFVHFKLNNSRIIYSYIIISDIFIDDKYSNVKLELNLRFIQNFTIFNDIIPSIVNFYINNDRKNESFDILFFNLSKTINIQLMISIKR